MALPRATEVGSPGKDPVTVMEAAAIEHVDINLNVPRAAPYRAPSPRFKAPTKETFRA